MERIILMGGPCSGQMHEVEPGTPSIKVRDAAHGVHVYVRTNLEDDSDGERIVIFRPAMP